jgi:hypothetical protein
MRYSRGAMGWMDFVKSRVVAFARDGDRPGLAASNMQGNGALCPGGIVFIGPIYP